MATPGKIPTKFMDVSAPATSSPSASSRPIITSSGALLTRDPMVTAINDNGNSPAEKAPEEAPIETNVINHHEKHIQPLNTDTDTNSDELTIDTTIRVSDESEKVTRPQSNNGEVVVKPEPKLTMSETKPAPPEPVAVSELDSSNDTVEPSRAEVAEDAKQLRITEEADAKREAEIEKLVETGTYFVPIDAVKRSRQHALVLELVALTLVLALVIGDVLLDTGVLKYSGIPQTNFFK